MDKSSDEFGLMQQWQDSIHDEALAMTCDRRIGPYPCCSVVQGDCLVLMRELADRCVDAVITDIPYGEVNRQSGGLRNLDKGIADIATFDTEELAAVFARLATGTVYSFCGTEQVSGIRATFVSSEMLTRLCIWEKPNPSPMNGDKFWLSSIECCVFGRKPKAPFNEFCVSPVWRNNVQREQEHPTQKPVELMARLVSASTNEFDTILDPFCGSGTTLVAAKKLGRHYLGFEISAEYCEISRRRLAEIDAQPTLFEPKPEQLSL